MKTSMLVRSTVFRDMIDDDIRQVLIENMRKTGLDIRVGITTKTIKNPDGSLTVTMEKVK